MQPGHNPAFGPVFDADNHYWESSDAFTRFRSAKFADRGVRLAELDGQLRYFIGDKPHPLVPGPGDVHGRPRPGMLYDYFSGREPIDPARHTYDEQASDHPDWFNRDARIKVMDEQGLEACWMFPSGGVCMEGPMQPDIKASLHILGAFNRWIEDEWGFAYRNRIFGVPFLALSDLDNALAELDWAMKCGARVISIRNGPVFTCDGNKSPADPIFDQFWARVEEAGLVVTAHAGFDDGYRDVDNAVARSWGIDLSDRKTKMHLAGGMDFSSTLVTVLQKKRLVHDFAAILVTHGLFTRFPRLKFAFIENGALWVGPLLHDLQVVHVQHPGMFASNPVDQFHRNCSVAPFVEDDVAELAKHIPTERILFGSDWPHAEGIAHPRDFFGLIEGFTDSDVRRIMHDNAHELTFA
jgi:predicted TIM-barrel fold metal-dependent hydrolase